MPFLERQMTGRLLHSLEVFEKDTQTPLVFLDFGYGNEEIFGKFSFASYTLCHFLESFPPRVSEKRPDFFHRVILDKLHLPFVATFDVMIVNFVHFLPLDPASLLRQLIGCLKPGGRLYFVGLGEFSFYEWFLACQKAEIPFSFPSFLSQRQPIWPEDHKGGLQEEWVELNFAHLDPLMAFFERLQKNLFDCVPSLPDKILKAFDLFLGITGGRLTVHLFYGRYTKPQKILEE